MCIKKHLSSRNNLILPYYYFISCCFLFLSLPLCDMLRFVSLPNKRRYILQFRSRIDVCFFSDAGLSFPDSSFANDWILWTVVFVAFAYTYCTVYVQIALCFCSSLIADTRESAEAALNASNAYQAIINAINSALNASLEAIRVAEEASSLVSTFDAPFHSFILDISIASLPLLLRGTPDYCIGTVSELTRQSTTGNYEWRTFPRSLRGD